MEFDNQKDIPKCNILGVKIAAVNIDWLLRYIEENLEGLSGKYICVANVHTTVMSYEDKAYCEIQNQAFMVLPDGKPLSVVGNKRGFSAMHRITGPDLMQRIFEISPQLGYRHYFYGSTKETIEMLQERLLQNYPGIQIAGSYSPPFRNLEPKENNVIVKKIKEANPHFIWVGLGAPKQEKWMADHKNQFSAIMIGVGAGFDYHAGKLKRAPKWMQDMSLEWLYRLCQEPKRLWRRYFTTNLKFVWLMKNEKGTRKGD